MTQNLPEIPKDRFKNLTGLVTSAVAKNDSRGEKLISQYNFVTVRI